MLGEFEIKLLEDSMKSLMEHLGNTPLYWRLKEHELNMFRLIFHLASEPHYYVNKFYDYIMNMELYKNLQLLKMLYTAYHIHVHSGICQKIKVELNKDSLLYREHLKILL
jgi:hypothetical protein